MLSVPIFIGKKEKDYDDQDSTESPPLVRRCNCTTAGQGYLEVIWIVLEKVLYGQCTLAEIQILRR